MADLKWQECRTKASLRAGGKCEVWAKLSAEERASVQFALHEDRVLDGMHVVPRSASRDLMYDPDNVVFGMRYFHRQIDNLVDPLTGDMLNWEGRIRWFKRFMKEKAWDKVKAFHGWED